MNLFEWVSNIFIVNGDFVKITNKQVKYYTFLHTGIEDLCVEMCKIMTFQGKMPCTYVKPLMFGILVR